MVTMERRSLDGLIGDFRTDLAADGSSVATIDCYSRDLRQIAAALQRISGVVLGEETPAQIAATFADLAATRNTATVARRRSAYVRWLGCAALRRWIDPDRAAVLTAVLPTSTREHSRPQPLPDDTVARLLAVDRGPRRRAFAQARRRALLAVLVETGLRLEALLALPVAALTPGDGGALLTVERTRYGSPGRYPLTASATTALIEYLAVLAAAHRARYGVPATRAAPLWGRESEPRLPVTRSQVWCEIRRLAQRAGLTGISPQAFRQAAIARGLATPLPPLVLAERFDLASSTAYELNARCGGRRRAPRN